MKNIKRSLFKALLAIGSTTILVLQLGLVIYDICTNNFTLITFMITLVFLINIILVIDRFSTSNQQEY